jgi:predicted nucleotidyltransferase
MNLIDKYNSQLISLCEKHNVNELSVFGSILTNNFNQYSDVDFVVDFKGVERKVYADNYFNFKKSLENLFNRKIDLLEKIALKNPYFIQVLNDTKKMVYVRS